MRPTIGQRVRLINQRPPPLIKFNLPVRWLDCQLKEKWPIFPPTVESEAELQAHKTAKFSAQCAACCVCVGAAHQAVNVYSETVHSDKTWNNNFRWMSALRAVRAKTKRAPLRTNCCATGIQPADLLINTLWELG
jgi:hypothetical protein